MSIPFNELRAQRLSVYGRGILFTLLSLEGKLVKESVLTALCGSHWTDAVAEIQRCGIGRLVRVDLKNNVYRFEHYVPPEERRRIYLREHKRKMRKKEKGQDNGQAQETL